MFLLASLGRSKVLLGASGGGLGVPWLPPGAPGGPLGGLGAVLGGPLGDLGAALGGRGAPSKSTFGKQAALQNHWFYCINGYILALERGLGGTWGGEVEAKTGVEELRGNRGAHKKTKTKRAGADEEKKGPKGTP